jgi:Tol biopolymer transport system component
MQLEWLAEPGAAALTTASGSVAAPAIPPARRTAVGRRGLALAALAGALVVGAIWLLAHVMTTVPHRPMLRFRIVAPNGISQIAWPRISPDGRTLAFLGTDSSGVVRIWVRPLDSEEARPLPTTEGASRMFWAPTSRALAFMEQGELRQVSVDGGPSTPISRVPSGSDGTWGRDVMLIDANLTDSIRSVPVGGGDPRPAMRVDRARGESGNAWPSFLPDGRHFLAVANNALNLTASSAIRFGVTGSLDTRVVGETDGRAEYAEPGYLLFIRENTLMARRFDAASGKTSGDPHAVVENLSTSTASGDFTTSLDGTLVYRTASTSEGTRLLWVDRAGREAGPASAVGAFGDVTLSPVGHRVAYSLQTGNLAEVWVRDLDRGTDQRVTFEGHFDFNPVWSPDGQRIAYASDVSGAPRIYIRRADGTGDRDSLPSRSDSFCGPVDWSADGTRILARVNSAQGLWDIVVYTAPFHDPPRPFAATPFIERWASISPDGRWIAYESNETGRFEIFVRPADGSPGRWQVSARGGRYPLWRRDGKELFFQAPDQSIVSAAIHAQSGFAADTPVALFHHELATLGYTGRPWSVSPDGQRFLLTVPALSSERPHFDVWVNWAESLRHP